MFKFRAECQYDVELVKRKLSKDINTWVEKKITLFVEVEFSIKQNRLNLEQLKEIIWLLPECHVIAKSINLSELYKNTF